MNTVSNRPTLYFLWFIGIVGTLISLSAFVMPTAILEALTGVAGVSSYVGISWAVRNLGLALLVLVAAQTRVRSVVLVALFARILNEIVDTYVAFNTNGAGAAGSIIVLLVIEVIVLLQVLSSKSDSSMMQN